MGNGMIIKGNFAPARDTRILRILIKVLGVFLAIAIVTSLVIYGLTVGYEENIVSIGKRTRSLGEINKELQVVLNQIQSYKNVEAAAGKVPQLHLSNDVIEVMNGHTKQLPKVPAPEGALPRVNGY